MKTIADLRQTLFDTIDAVKNGTLDVEKARVIDQVSKTIVETAKVEVDYIRVIGEGETTFLPPKAGRPPALPGTPPGNGIGSAVQQLTNGGRHEHD